MTVEALARKQQGHGDTLGEGENPFSTNKVTGHSLNFPIVGTCAPTKLCARECYFSVGPATWRASLDKQHRLLNSVRAAPMATGVTIAAWAKRLRLDFVRWNGGGDLVPEAVACIDTVAAMLPQVPQWIVTRKPAVAAGIKPRPNVFVHFSVDAGSWDRLADFAGRVPVDLQWFWSYQCGPGEVPRANVAAVIFRDGYNLAGSDPVPNDCPLNLLDDIAGACQACRRCFNGKAVTEAALCRWNQP